MLCIYLRFPNKKKKWNLSYKLKVMFGMGEKRVKS